MLLHDTFDYSAREHPDVEFATQGRRRVSYAEAQALANRIANALVARGLAPGERVALLSKNSIEHALWYYACSKCGVVPVPLNYRLAPPEWSYIVNDAGAKFLFAQDALAQAIAPVRGELASVKHWVALGADVSGWERFESFVAGQTGSAPAHRAAPDDDLYQMYTSGTTGRPKGAVLTHRAVVSQLHQISLAVGAAPGERTLIVAPLYHAAASLSTFVTVQSGGSLYIQEDFVPGEVVRALSEERIALAMLVPAMIQFCLVAVPDVAARRYDTLRLIIYGASPIAEQTLTRAIEVFDCDFIQGYGMTETTSSATYLMPADHRRALAGEPKLLLSAGRRAARHRGSHHRRGRPHASERRDRRNRRARSAADARLLEPAGGDCGCIARRLAVHRRRRRARRRGLSLRAGPHQGHDRLGWRECLSARGGGRALPASRRRRGRRDRRAGSEVGRGGEGHRGREARTDARAPTS